MYIKISGKIDFDLLKKQKQIFERMIQDWGEANDEQQREEASEAEGLLFLIDNIQNEGEIIQIKNEYSEIDNQLKELHKKQNQLSKSLIEVLDNETDINKRKEIIDFVFADKVEEVHEYSFRKMYL
jgi:seryl-tRNA synthetase